MARVWSVLAFMTVFLVGYSFGSWYPLTYEKPPQQVVKERYWLECQQQRLQCFCADPDWPTVNADDEVIIIPKPAYPVYRPETRQPKSNPKLESAMKE